MEGRSKRWSWQEPLEAGETVSSLLEKFPRSASQRAAALRVLTAESSMPPPGALPDYSTELISSSVELMPTPCVPGVQCSGQCPGAVPSPVCFSH